MHTRCATCPTVFTKNRAEVGAKNSKGLTPLHVSCLKPNVAMVRLLLLWGADTNARDRKKRTPEHVIGQLLQWQYYIMQAGVQVHS